MRTSCRSSFLAFMAALSLVIPAAAGEPSRPLTDFYDVEWIASDSGEVIALEQVADRLASYDVIFFGEMHGHAGIHRQQTALLAALYARHPDLILSMEQFETDTQTVLDDYLAGKMGERALTEKGRAWSHYAQSYRPTLEFAKAHGLPVIASEAPTWAIACIGQNGPEILDKFTPEDRALVAKDLHIILSGAYYDKYMAFATGSSHGGGTSPDASERAHRSYAAQVARDDTMADSIDRALRQKPGAKVLHLNGYFHSAAGLGTVERLKWRNPSLKIAVITPVDASIIGNAERAEGDILLRVQPVPPMFIQGEDPSAFMGSLKRTQCKYAQ